MIIKTKRFGDLNYVISFPNDFDKTKKYPLILFLHGAGSRGNDISEVLKNPFYKITEGFENFEFITVAPQCVKDTWFDIFSELIELLKYISNLENANSQRIYGIGASMGGYGIWQLAMSCPEIFAAIIPICGGGMYWNALRLKNVPIWAFHGDNDTIVDKSESVKMTVAVNRFGGNAKLTIYKNCGHDAWTNTYKNKEIYSWLLKNRKNKSESFKTAFYNSKKYG